MLKVSNLEAFNSTINGWLAAVEEAAEEVTKALVLETLTYILKESPQASGDFVANWNTSLDAPVYDFTPNAVGGLQYFQGRRVPTYQKGSSPAIQRALANAKTALSGFTLGQKVYLANDSHHRLHLQRYKGDLLAFEGLGGDSHYSWKLENGMIKLRPVNKGADHMVMRSITRVGALYKTISATQLANLKTGRF